MSKKILLEKLTNTRDLGGMETKDGRTIKPKMLLRSGQLYTASESDVAHLQGYVSQIVDFRTVKEREEKPDPVMEGVTNIHLPIIEDVTLGITREESTDKASMQELMAGLMSKPDVAMQYMVNLYKELVASEHALSQYTKFVDLLLAEDNKGATLWHCTAGKDRAGFGTVIVLEALGVDREIIMEDYLQTNICLQGEIEGMLQSLKQQVDVPGLEEAVRSFFGAKEAYLQSIYCTIEEVYGSFEAFLDKALGVTEEKRNMLKERYLTGE